MGSTSPGPPSRRTALRCRAAWLPAARHTPCPPRRSRRSALPRGTRALPCRGRPCGGFRGRTAAGAHVLRGRFVPAVVSFSLHGAIVAQTAHRRITANAGKAAKCPSNRQRHGAAPDDGPANPTLPSLRAAGRRPAARRKPACLTARPQAAAQPALQQRRAAAPS